MTSKSAFKPLLSRTLTSLAAIIAVSAIFGAKALEAERRHDGEKAALSLTPAADRADAAR